MTKYAIKKANCTKFALKYGNSNTSLKYGVKMSLLRHVMNPHIKNNPVRTVNGYLYDFRSIFIMNV